MKTIREPVPAVTIQPAALRSWRRKMRWRQSDAARAFTVSVRRYQKWENREQIPPTWVGYAAAALLHGLPPIQ